MKCAYALDEKPCRAPAITATGYCTMHTAAMRTVERQQKEIEARARAEREAEIETEREAELEAQADVQEPIYAEPEADPEDPTASAWQQQEELLSRFKREAKPSRDARRVAPARRPMRAEEPEAAEDPDDAAARMTADYLREEREARLEQKERRRNDDGTLRADTSDRYRDPSRATYRVIPRIPVADETEMIDPITGKRPKSIPPGWVTRWVAVRDHHDRPTRTRVAKRERCGWMAVPDANGDPIEGIYGLAMMGPREAQTAFTLLGTSAGTQRRNDALEAASQMAADMKEYIGDAAGGVVIGSDHAHDREMATPAREAQIMRDR